MDIGYQEAYPASALSNFAPNKFTLDGIDIACMEAFLQAVKFRRFEVQVEICRLVGRHAKFRGYYKHWWKLQRLYWQGVVYNRHGPAYQHLLDRAYSEMYSQSDFFRAALAKTRGPLTHSIGKNNPNETVLTEDEFCSRLIRLREKGTLL